MNLNFQAPSIVHLHYTRVYFSVVLMSLTFSVYFLPYDLCSIFARRGGI